MAAITDYLSTNGPSTPLAWQMSSMVPQYRVNETLPNLQQDSTIATQRALQDFSTRTLPDMQNQGAALGQSGSTGLANRELRAGQDVNRNVTDIGRMFYRNAGSIAKQKIMATMGSMF